MTTHFLGGNLRVNEYNGRVIICEGPDGRVEISPEQALELAKYLQRKYGPKKKTKRAKDTVTIGRTGFFDDRSDEMLKFLSKVRAPTKKKKD